MGSTLAAILTVALAIGASARIFDAVNASERAQPAVTESRAEPWTAGDPARHGDTCDARPPVREATAQDPGVARLLLLGAVMSVLLIAAADGADLTLERAMARRQARAARGAPGPRRRRRMLLGVMVVALAGGALGLLVALWGLERLANV